MKTTTQHHDCNTDTKPQTTFNVSCWARSLCDKLFKCVFENRTNKAKAHTLTGILLNAAFFNGFIVIFHICISYFPACFTSTAFDWHRYVMLMCFCKQLSFFLSCHLFRSIFAHLFKINFNNFLIESLFAKSLQIQVSQWFEWMLQLLVFNWANLTVSLFLYASFTNQMHPHN